MAQPYSNSQIVIRTSRDLVLYFSCWEVYYKTNKIQDTKTSKFKFLMPCYVLHVMPVSGGLVTIRLSNIWLYRLNERLFTPDLLTNLWLHQQCLRDLLVIPSHILQHCVPVPLPIFKARRVENHVLAGSSCKPHPSFAL